MRHIEIFISVSHKPDDEYEGVRDMFEMPYESYEDLYDASYDEPGDEPFDGSYDI